MPGLMRTTTGGETEMEQRNVLRLSNEESNQLTRECIQTALIKLLAEKPLEKITISEVVKKAGVSRTAFYSNYTSKEDVLVAVSHGTLSELNALVRRAAREQRPETIYQEIFNRALNDPDSFSVLLKARIQERAFDDVNSFLQREYPNANSQFYYLLQGWSGMLLNILTAWFTGGMKDSVDDMAALCLSLSQEVVAKVRQVEPQFMKTENPEARP